MAYPTSVNSQITDSVTGDLTPSEIPNPPKSSRLRQSAEELIKQAEANTRRWEEEFDKDHTPTVDPSLPEKPETD